MNKVDVAKILAILEVAYPHSYKDMDDTKKIAMGALWERKFSEIPADLVFLAVDKIIETSKFAPTVADVVDKLADIYWDNYMEKWASDCGTLLLSADEKRRVDYIHHSLSEIVDGGESAILIGGYEHKKMLLGG